MGVDVGKMRLSLIIFISFFSCVFAGFAQDKVIELQPVTKSENLDRDDWCKEIEDYFVDNCPIQRGDYNGCCLCTQRSFATYKSCVCIFKNNSTITMAVIAAENLLMKLEFWEIAL